jgi:hypothetical protein
MGTVTNVGFAKWPKQGKWLGKRTKVCFNYDTSQTVMGTIVRDDYEEPWRTIISLDDGRVVLASECQHQPDPPDHP